MVIVSPQKQMSRTNAVYCSTTSTTSNTPPKNCPKWTSETYKATFSHEKFRGRMGASRLAASYQCGAALRSHCSPRSSACGNIWDPDDGADRQIAWKSTCAPSSALRTRDLLCLALCRHDRLPLGDDIDLSCKLVCGHLDFRNCGG